MHDAHEGRISSSSINKRLNELGSILLNDEIMNRLTSCLPPIPRSLYGI